MNNHVQNCIDIHFHFFGKYVETKWLGCMVGVCFIMKLPKCFLK